MKRILLFLFPLLPYLASAQVAKDTVTVLTIAQIPAGEIRDTTNFTFVQDNAFRKATFDSLAKYTRVKLIGDRGDITVSGATGLTWELDAGVVDSMQLSAGAVVLPGAKVTGTLPVSKGGTGLTTLTGANHIPYATSATALTTSAGLTFDGTNFATTGTASATKLIPTGGSATGNGMYLPATNTLGFSTNDVERMRIDASGNLGIGTNSPNNKLQITAAAGSSHARWTESATTVGFVGGAQGIITGVNGSFAVRAENGLVLSGAGNATTMFFNSSNNVGIGTNDPQAQLHTTGGVRFATFAGGGTTTLSVDNAGDLLRTPSTIEYKKDIEPIRYGLKEVLALQPVNFNWIDEDRFGSVNENGFVAEDVMNVLPNVANADGNGVFMDYTKLIAVLTKAIQEQQAQIEQLKQRITQLENK